MRLLRLLVAVFAVSTQACATMLQNATSEYGTRFGEIRGDRPSVTDGLKGGQTAIPGFGATPNHRSVPSSLPLPVEANPRATFAGPSLGRHTVNSLFGGVAVVIAALCAPERHSASCEQNKQRDFEKTIPFPAANKGPIILR